MDDRISDGFLGDAEHTERPKLALRGSARVKPHRRHQERTSLQALKVIDHGFQNHRMVGDPAAAARDGNGLAGPDFLPQNQTGKFRLDRLGKIGDGGTSESLLKPEHQRKHKGLPETNVAEKSLRSPLLYSRGSVLRTRAGLSIPTEPRRLWRGAH
jgi:hypothetical protein